MNCVRRLIYVVSISTIYRQEDEGIATKMGSPLGHCIGLCDRIDSIEVEGCWSSLAEISLMFPVGKASIVTETEP
jgi:hypothetical protein